MDTISYILAKKYIEGSLSGAGALIGKSAFEIAKDNGFNGTEEEWLISLKGSIPTISDSGTWIIDGVDTKIVASPDLAGYVTKEELNEKQLTLEALSKEEILSIIKMEENNNG